MKKNVVVVIGTRPEAIKLIPLYLELKKAGIPTYLCATFQHSELLTQVFDLFLVKPDYNLNVMQKNQDLFFLTQAVMNKTKEVFLELDPALVLVQGDTTTAFAAALAAFYLKVPLGHVEAGLRSGNKYSPYPEEVNRMMVSTLANYHFAPTALNVANLLAQGISRDEIFCTGNTVIDALHWIREQINTDKITVDKSIRTFIENEKSKKNKIVLFTAHRRESFKGGLERILSSLGTFAQAHPDVTFFYPFHPNPHVIKEIDKSGIKDIPNIKLSPPILYKDLVFLLMSCDWVISDSGGIQEEAISFGKHVLVVREHTERPEGIWEGMLTLAGTNEKSILLEMSRLYKKEATDKKHCTVYGDGNACKRIVAILKSSILPSDTKKISKSNGDQIRFEGSHL